MCLLPKIHVLGSTAMLTAIYTITDIPPKAVGVLVLLFFLSDEAHHTSFGASREVLGRYLVRRGR